MSSILPNSSSSTATSSRWHEVMMRRFQSEPSNKRSRSVDSDMEDDVSRSPTPHPNDDALLQEVGTVSVAPPEVIDINTRIGSSNKGFALLSKLGWNEGQPLGLSPDARVDPIPFSVKQERMGLGKSAEDARVIESTVSHRREMDSEKQIKESEEQRRFREEKAAQESILRSEISQTLKSFYCQLCDKQFKNVAQYDEHTNSYAHAHKARAKDMHANIKLKPAGHIDQRKEKERRREEKELKKIAKAAGVKLASTVSQPTRVNLAKPDLPPTEPSKKESRWAALSSSNMDVSSPPPPPPPSEPQHPGRNRGFQPAGWSASRHPTGRPPSPSPPPPPPDDNYVPPPPPPA